MRIYVSHSAGDGTWFVVEPIDSPEVQIESLVDADRTVVALDVEPRQGPDDKTANLLLRTKLERS